MLYSHNISIQPQKRRKKCQKNRKIPTRMAWKLPSDFCANILDALKKILLSDEFADRHKNSPTDFTRDRKLPFHLLVCFLISIVKGSYQVELNGFFKIIGGLDVAQKVVSKAALTNARKKLKHSVFVELNQHLIRFFEKFFNIRRWHGFRLVAVDGSTCRLPNIKEIAEYFGVHNGNKGKPSAMARVSQLFDTLNKISIGAIITPKKVGERQHAYDLFQNLRPKDLVLLDRGYPAFWLFKQIFSMKADFCARINATWEIVQEFIESGADEWIVTLSPSAPMVKKCTEMGLDFEPITVRLIRIELESGEIEILITSLVDTKRYSYEIFKDLYHARWPIEEDYKAMKCWMQLENFSGKSVLSVYQDFHAKVFLKNLTSVLCFPVQNTLDENGKKEKYCHQVNFAQALSNMKNVTPLLFQRAIEEIPYIIRYLQKLFMSATEPIRPGRQFPRKHKVSVRRFHFSYKAGA